MILHALVVQGLANDMSADEVVNKMVDRLIGSLHDANLDDTILAKTHADKTMGLPYARGAVAATRAMPSSMVSLGLRRPLGNPFMTSRMPRDTKAHYTVTLETPD